MKYFVKLALTVEAGNAIEKKPGGPGPVVGRLLERFKPESVYMTVNERAILMVVDLPQPSDIAELMVVGAQLGGQYPTITPVVSGQEFGGIAEKVLSSALQLIGD